MNQKAWLIVVGAVALGGSISLGYFLGRSDGVVSAPLHVENPEPSDAQLLATGFDLSVNPHSVVVQLDGREIGRAPLRVRNIEPGTHILELKAKDGYFGLRTEVLVLEGEAQSLHYDLEQVVVAKPQTLPLFDAGIAPATPAKKKGKTTRHSSENKTSEEPASDEVGWLAIGSKPPCAISIDGKKTGLTTPQTAISLGVGIHRVRLENAELGLKSQFRVKIAKGKRTRVIKDLRSSP